MTEKEGELLKAYLQSEEGQNDPFTVAIRAQNDDFERRSADYMQRLVIVSSLQVPSHDLPNVKAQKPNAQAQFFGQGEFRYASSDESIGTMGVGPCLGILLVGKNGAAGAHVDGISDPHAFVNAAIHRVEAEKAFLLGGQSELHMTYEVYEKLKDRGLDVVVSTQNGPQGFIYNVSTGGIHLNPVRDDFVADWERYDRMADAPMMQASLIDKNPLSPAR